MVYRARDVDIDSCNSWNNLINKDGNFSYINNSKALSCFTESKALLRSVPTKQ